MAKVKKRKRKKRDSDLQRRDRMSVDLSGDSLEVARKRTDNLLRNILNFMPGEIEVKVFNKFATEDVDFEKSILIGMRDFVKQNFSEHMSRIDEVTYITDENSPVEGEFDLVLSPDYKNTQS